MLTIRLQRTGRRGHASFRVVVQDSRTSPTSGKIVAHLGHYDPHTKESKIDKEKAEFYLKNGAQPSDRVVALLKKDGVKLPKWVTPVAKKTSQTKNVEKLRKNRPAEPKEEKPAEKTADEPAEAEAPAEEPADKPQEETAEAPKAEEPENSKEDSAQPTEPEA